MKKLHYALLFLLLFGSISTPQAMKSEDKRGRGKRVEINLVDDEEKPAVQKQQKKEDTEFKKPLPPSKPMDPLESLILETSKIEWLRSATMTIYGLELDELISEVRRGSKEAPGKIGTACYLASRDGLGIYPVSVSQFEEGDSLTLTFQWFSHAHSKEDESILEEFAFCNLYEFGNPFGFFDALRFFKKAQGIIPPPLPTREEDLKRRLVRAESGFERYIDLDKDRATRVLLQGYMDQKQKTALCIGANSLIRLKEKPLKVKQGLTCLESLALRDSYPLAQWLYGRAIKDGIGVKTQLDLGLKWILQAAQNKCPQAMLFLNSSFPLKENAFYGQDDKNPFNGTMVSEVNKLVIILDQVCSQLSNLGAFEGYDDFSAFEKDFRIQLNALKKAEPALWITCLGLSPELEARCGELRESPLIEYADECFTIGEETIRISRAFKAYTAQIDEKFKAVARALRTIKAGIEVKLTETKKETSNQSDVIKSLERKKGRVKNCFAELSKLKTGLLGVEKATEAKRNQNFLSHYSFFYKIGEEDEAK